MTSVREALEAASAGTASESPDPFAEDAVDQVDGGGAAADTTETAAPEALSAPDDWEPEDKELFGKLPREAQEFAVKRHEKVSGRIKDLDERAKRGDVADSYDRVFQPMNQKLMAQGVTPQQFAQQFVGVAMGLDNPQTRAATFDYLFRVYGHDPRQQGQQQPQIDPALAPVYQQVNQLGGAVNALLNQQQTSTQAAALAEVTAFQNERGQDGQPLRPLWGEVEHDLVPLVQALRNANPQAQPRDLLQRAYDAAVYANPKTAQRALEARMAADRAAQQAADKTKVDEAKRRAGLSGGAPRTADPAATVADNSIRGNISRAWAQQAGNA